MIKKLGTTCLILIFLIFGLIFSRKNDSCRVQEVISPVEIVLDNGKIFTLKDFETFDGYHSKKNKILAEKLHISETEAFITGSFAKYWTQNLLENREVELTENDLIFDKRSYAAKFANSAFCIKDGKPANEAAFQRYLKSIKKTKFEILETAPNEFLVMKKSHFNRIFKKQDKRRKQSVSQAGSSVGQAALHKIPSFSITLDDIKITVSDHTGKIKPDRMCSSDICKEILSNINSAKTSVDIAIYDYSSSPEIEAALQNAINRGVKIRLVYDADTAGKNLYPDTSKLTDLISNNISDKNSKESSSIMHNKFYIFDDKIVITGSANLSHTDMSGFNSNSIITIHSPEIAKIYKTEFEQIYGGRFHNDKTSTPAERNENIIVLFSPQDKGITNGILPLIGRAEKYIYMPVFVITEKRVTDELIKAKKRGVNVRLIIDALNASGRYSKHRELREAGILVKVENYAGKMHSKSIITDDEYVVIGSMNFSNSGENKNDENLIILKSPQAAKFYRKLFEYQWEKIPDKWLRYAPKAESPDSIGSCSDGTDNDYDGYIDAEDPDCIPAVFSGKQ